MAPSPRPQVRIADIEPEARDGPFRVMIVGESGSGKSSLVEKMLAEVLARRDAAIVLDIGGGMREFVAAHAPPGTPVSVLDPYAEDGAAPNFAELLATETDQQAMTWKLMPKVEGDTSPFFINTARGIHKDNIASLHRFAPGLFTLGDTIRLSRNMALASALGRRAPGVGDPWRRVRNEETRDDVYSTLVTALGPFSIVAALWDASKRAASIMDFVRRREGVLILPWRDRHATALESIYAYLFDTMADYLLEDPSESPVWYFLDEYRQLAPMDFIGNVVRRGRKSGVNICATLLEMAGLRDRYNPARAEEQFGLFNHLVVLKCGSVETAEACSRRLGHVEVLEDVAPRHVRAADRGTGSFTRHVRERPNVTVDEIRTTRSVVATGVRGWADFPGFRGEFECPWLARRPSGLRPAIQKPRSAEVLGDFRLDDIARLNFPATKDVADAIQNLNP